MKNIQIAMDGPSGAGKSTIAKLVAKTLDILYLDTGAMYRAVALKGIRRDIDLTEEEPVTVMMAETDIDIVYRDGNQRVLLDGEDVSEAIRTNEVSMGASRVSAHPAVRDRMVATQQRIAKKSSVIMDGRDIGTKVLPNADLKIFLTASPEERAMRRYLELQEKGMADLSYEALLDEIRERDQNDSNRSHSPLVQAEDAILVDTTGFNIETAVETVMQIIRNANKSARKD